MSAFPPLPAWNGLHPLVVHFPIALILVSPIFVVLALVWRSHTVPLLASALLMVAIGAGSAYLATSTGDAAGELAEKLPGVKPVLERHEELAETAANLAAGLTGVLAAGTLVMWRRGRTMPRAAVLGGAAVYLVLHGAVALVLANAAHEGGRLVHELGVRAPLAAAAPATSGARGADHRDGDD